MSFALGATIYFARKDDARPADVRLGALATAAWAINLLAEGTIFPDGYALYAGFYVNTVLAALVVVFLSGLEPGPRLKKLDEALGQSELPGLPVSVARRLRRLSPLVGRAFARLGTGARPRCRSSSPSPRRSPGPARSSSSRCAPGFGGPAAAAGAKLGLPGAG